MPVIITDNGMTITPLLYLKGIFNGLFLWDREQMIIIIITAVKTHLSSSQAHVHTRQCEVQFPLSF